MAENRNGQPRVAIRKASETYVEVSPTPQAAAAAPTQSILEILWRRRWVVVGCVVLSLAAAAAYLWRATPFYSSTAQIYIEQNRPKIIGDGLTRAADSSSYLYTQCEVIKSSGVVTAALQSPEVEQAGALVSGAGRNPLAYVQSVLDVRLSKQGDIILVTLESPRPQEAATLVNAIVGAYIAQHNQKHRSTAVEVLRILQGEKKQYEDELKAYSDRMLAYQRENGVFSFEGDKGNAVTRRFLELSDALTKAQLDTLRAKVTAESANALKDDPLRLQEFLASLPGLPAGAGGAALAPAGPQVSEAEVRQMRRRLDAIRAQLGPNHPTVQALAKELKAAEQENGQVLGEMTEGRREMLAAQLAVLVGRYEEAKRLEQALQQDFDDQQKKAVELNAKTAEYNVVVSGARRAEQLLNTIDSRIKEIRVNSNDEAASLSSISVLEVAKPVLDPVRPKRPQTLGLALAFGLALGAGAATLLDWADQRLRSADEIAAVLDLPILGAIPHIAGTWSAAERGRDIELEPRSPVAEAYRTVRTAVHFGFPDSNNKTILVTSPSPGDGKSTVASNLALAFAQANRRVLLIDADCRKPVQHKIFGVEHGTGLSSVLVGDATADAATRRAVANTLDLMPCGPLPPNPSEMLASEAFGDLIAALSLQYDQIVIDSPPVVAVTDARILTALCDGTVLVLRAEKSTRKLSEHARDALLRVGGLVLGVVVNDVPRGRGKDGYYYSGYGYYSYGYGHESPARGRGKGSGKIGKPPPSTALLVQKTLGDEAGPPEPNRFSPG